MNTKNQLPPLTEFTSLEKAFGAVVGMGAGALAGYVVSSAFNHNAYGGVSGTVLGLAVVIPAGLDAANRVYHRRKLK